MTTCDFCKWGKDGAGVVKQCDACLGTDAIMSPQGRLATAIQTSGLSARAFAREILLRDERTIRRWLAGDSPIPEAVMRFLDKGELVMLRPDQALLGKGG